LKKELNLLKKHQTVDLLMTDIERDLDYIIIKTQQLFDMIEQKKYHLIETKELVRQQLIEQFFVNYTADEIVTVNEKFQKLVNFSTQITKECESIFEQTKKDILKLKQVGKIKKAYK
jgi:hypothetical protein